MSGTVQHRTRMSATILIAFSVLAFLVSACKSTPSSGPNPTRSPSSTPTTSTPTELQGTWITTLQATSERVTLTFDATGGFVVVREPNRSSGQVVFAGDQVEFEQASACSGTGKYRWSIDAGKLRFTPVVTDECPGRAAILEGQSYSRAP